MSTERAGGVPRLVAGLPRAPCTPPAEPIRVVDPALLAAIYRLRVDAWMTEGLIPGPVNADGLRDEHDSHALHWAILVGGRICAAARMCIHHSVVELPDAGAYRGTPLCEPGPIASINRLVVHTTCRGRGFARSLDAVRIAAAREMDCRWIVCTARPRRARQLERMGFREVGPAADSLHLLRNRRSHGITSTPNLILSLHLGFSTESSF